MSRKIVICDLDGTLYNSESRSELARKKRWEEFHAASINDEPNHDVAKLVRVLAFGGLEVIAITGRNDAHRRITDMWIGRHGIPITTTLMRPSGNFNSDVEVKLSLLHTWLGEQDLAVSDVLFALDDRDKMVAGWRAAGINCYQVRPSEY